MDIAYQVIQTVIQLTATYQTLKTHTIPRKLTNEKTFRIL